MSKWLREISTNNTGNNTGLPFAAVCLAWYFKELLGYTSYTASESFTSYTVTGTNGEFNLTGTDKSFKDATASAFVSGDVGKYLVVKSANTRNSGIYKILTYVDATTVTIDFRSGTYEYPTAETGITWWVINPATAPTTESAYFRCTTPHAYGWSLEIALNNISTAPQISARISVDGTWGTKIIGPVYFGSVASATNWLFAEADTAGAWINIWFHQATNNRYNGCIVSNVDPFDSGHLDTEKVVLMGNTGTSSSDYDNGNFNRNYDSKRVGHGYVWVDGAVAAQKDIYFLEPTYSGYTNGLSKYTSRERNRRLSGSQVGGFTGDSLTYSTGSVTLADATATFTTADVGKKICLSNCQDPGNNGVFTITSRPSATSVVFANASGVTETSSFAWSMDFQDIVDGSYIVLDPDNTLGLFELYARLKGHYSVRGGTVSGWGNRKAFTETEVLDRYHINDGIAVSWPNLTPQY